MKHASVPLARNGDVCCRILLPGEAGAAEEYAAEELRLHLARMIGRSPRVGAAGEGGGPAIILNDADQARRDGVTMPTSCA